MTTRFYTRKAERKDECRLAQTLNSLYDDVQQLNDERDYYKAQAELYKAHYDMTCEHLLETMELVKELWTAYDIASEFAELADDTKYFELLQNVKPYFS